MTAKRRPKVRYVALGEAVIRERGQQSGWIVCECETKTDAKRIAAALNWHEAHKRGEL